MHKTPQLNQKKVYQFKATLLRIEPPIWRRILVPRGFSLNELHWIMQIAFGWTNDHLHEFVTQKRRRYGDPDFELSTFGEKRGNEYMTRLSRLNLTVKSKLIYEYDFGDSWEHLIEVEKVHLFDEDQQYPIVLDGERSGPRKIVEVHGGIRIFSMPSPIRRIPIMKKRWNGLKKISIPNTSILTKQTRDY